jgi:hypothetical protein
VAENGDSKVLKTYRTTDGFALGAWIHSQRQKYGNQELSKHECEQLEALPGWRWLPHDEAWERGLKELIKWYDAGGRGIPAQGYRTADGYGLGNWVKRQRDLYAESLLPAERVARLAELPQWTWESIASLDAKVWEATFVALRTFCDETGHLPPQGTLTPNGKNFRTWIEAQKTMHHTGRLSVERISKLESIPCWRWRGATESTKKKH